MIRKAKYIALQGAVLLLLLCEQSEQGQCDSALAARVHFLPPQRERSGQINILLRRATGSAFNAD